MPENKDESVKTHTHTVFFSSDLEHLKETHPLKQPLYDLPWHHRHVDQINGWQQGRLVLNHYKQHLFEVLQHLVELSIRNCKPTFIWWASDQYKIDSRKRKWKVGS